VADQGEALQLTGSGKFRSEQNRLHAVGNDWIAPCATVIWLAMCCHIPHPPKKKLSAPRVPYNISTPCLSFWRTSFSKTNRTPNEMDPIARRDPVISITSHCGNVTGSYNNVLNNCDISIADEKRAILEWLSPLDPRERHQAIGMDRMPGVGDWLLNTSEFTRWDQGGGTTSKPVLFCYGDPGVGKTYLRYERWLPSKSARVNNNNHSSLVIDKLCDLVEAGNKVVTCVYCDFYAQNAQSATGLLGAVLKQVVSALEPIPDEVKKVFKNSKGGLGGRRLLLPDILAMLVKSLSLLRQVFICIDALDEFPAKQRPELWESLQQIVRKCPSIRLFLTGRLHIRDEVQRYFPSSAEMLPISPSANDIGLYLRMRLNRDSEADARDEKLEADILRIIPEVTSGTYVFS